MCRVIAYSGHPQKLATLVADPEHSLIEQSQAATEARLSVNGDGFGFAWYGEDKIPGLYRDVLPAWSDGNLTSPCRMIKSHHFLAHVRASTVGETMRANCHPFSVGEWSFMHNGIIAGFDTIKRQLEESLPDALYNQRRGTSDSELFFLTLLANGLAEDPKRAVEKTLAQLQTLQSKIDQPNRITAVFSNGETLFALRTSCDAKSPSLYVSHNMISDGLILASEPLDSKLENWTAIPQGSFVSAPVWAGSTDAPRFDPIEIAQVA